jgi:heat-inducible transcriptional repressor
MTERQRDILICLVESYLKNGAAPSSSYLSESLGGKWSSATIRNDLVQLRRLGYIKQENRVSPNEPTDLGLSYYFGMKIVESMIDKQSIYRKPIEAVSLEDVLNSSTHMVSEDTGSPAVGIALVKPFVTSVKLVPIGSKKVAVLVVLDDGSVQSGVATLTISTTERELDLISSIVEEQVKGKLGNDAFTVINQMDFWEPSFDSIKEVLRRLLTDMGSRPKAVYLLGENPHPDAVKELNTFLRSATDGLTYVYHRIWWHIDLGVLIDDLPESSSIGMFADMSTEKVQSIMGVFVRRDKELDGVIRTLKGVKEIARKEIQKICD